MGPVKYRPNAAVWKFKLPLEAMSTIQMPVGAKIVHVGEQCGEICMWAEVDVTSENGPRLFYVVGTGHPMPQGALYHIGTVQIMEFVWHVYQGA